MNTPLIVDAAQPCSPTTATPTATRSRVLSAADLGTITLNPDGSFSPGGRELQRHRRLQLPGQRHTDDSDVATVMINVNPVNDLPVATNDEYVTDEDTALTIAVPGVLGNDTDIDGDALSSILVSGPTNGTLTMNADGSFEYTPNADFNGVDGFATADGRQRCGNCDINVTAVNDLPTADADSYATDEDIPLVIDAAGGLLANDADPDGDTLIGNPRHWPGQRHRHAQCRRVV
jgi:hypothetical protein